MNTIYAEYNMYHNSIDIYTIFIVSGTIVFKLHNIIPADSEHTKVHTASCIPISLGY